MAEAIRRLQEEHGNIARLPDVPEHEFAAFDATKQEDCDVLVSVAGNLTGFPDRCHSDVSQPLFMLMGPAGQAQVSMLCSLPATDSRWIVAMRNVIGQLRTEHANMARMLKILEKQIEIFEASGQPDYAITQDIILYFLDFPDQCHHPKEDLVAQILLELAPDRAGQLRGLAELHEELGALTRKVANVVRRVLDEAELPRAEVIRTVEEFIRSQRHHMEMEDAHFLPLAEEILSGADLVELESEIFQKEDPLFGPETEEHFAMLRDNILSWEQADSQE